MLFIATIFWIIYISLYIENLHVWHVSLKESTLLYEILNQILNQI